MSKFDVIYNRDFCVIVTVSIMTAFTDYFWVRLCGFVLAVGKMRDAYGKMQNNSDWTLTLAISVSRVFNVDTSLSGLCNAY